MRSLSFGFSCNNACVFCAQGDWRSRKPLPRDAEIESALEEALRSDKMLAFQGGEPTLNPELPRWIALAKTRGASWILLQTNGRRLLYSDYASRLARAGLDAVDVSLHGATAATHDYHTQIPGSFLQTLGGIQRSRAAGLQVGVTTVVTRSNFRNLKDIVHLAHSQGAQALHFGIASPHGKAGASWERVIPAAELVSPYLIEAARSARALGLELLALQLASSPDVGRLFAGIGETETAVSFKQGAPATAGDRPLGAKPAAAIGETRGSGKKTGADLREIFPGLFEVDRV